MSREDAERRAFMEFGNVVQIEEHVRDVRGRWLEDFRRDIGYAFRALGRHRGFAAVAVLSLALGIGANTAIFSVINGAILRTLPVREPGTLVRVQRVSDRGRPLSLSYPLFASFRDRMQSVTGTFAEALGDRVITIEGRDEFVSAEFVSGAYYPALGVTPVAGETPRPVG